MLSVNHTSFLWYASLCKLNSIKAYRERGSRPFSSERLVSLFSPSRSCLGRFILICGGQESSAGPSSPTLMQKRVKHQIWWNIKSPRWLSTPYSPDLDSCDFWLFPKLKSPLKGKRFQTIDEIQQNTRGKLMEIGRIVWGPKAPTLKGTEASLSYAQCFLYLVSSAINVSIFHITWLDRFWTDQIMLC